MELIFQTQVFNGYLRYSNEKCANPLTMGFLRRFYELAEQHYGAKLFEELQWMKNRVVLPKAAVGKREVYIPFSFCFAPQEKRLIFIEYGKVEEAEKWLPIFKTMVENFVLDNALPEIDVVTYWDLMKGTTKELSFPDAFLAPKDRVLQTARRLVEQAIGRRR